MPNKSTSNGGSAAAVMSPRNRSRPAIGPQVRRLRHDRRMTLAQVAERSGLNVGYLSQIENDKASPSLESLNALAGAIDVPMTWFLLDVAPAPRVVRASERRRWRGAAGVRVEEVDGGLPRDVRVVQVTTGSGQTSGSHAHAGEEHQLVVSGRLRVTQGPHTAELGPGDYLLWDATVPHDSEALGEEPAVVLIFCHQGQGSEASRPEH
jgi:transcriptional regulator with XRE-family HTH domain